MDTPTPLTKPDPHPAARVALTFLRSVIKITSAPAVFFAIWSTAKPAMLIAAIFFGAIVLMSFCAAFLIVFFYYAQYSLSVLSALLMVFNLLILCVISDRVLLVMGGILGIGLFLSLLCIRIVGFYPEIEHPPHGEIAFLLGAVGKVRFSLRTLIGVVLWIGLSIRLLSESLHPHVVWAGVICALALMGFLLVSVVLANVPREKMEEQ